MNNQDTEILKNLLNKTFFEAWKLENIDKEKYANYSSLEVQINAKCDLKCSYCYYNRFKDGLYPKEISNSDLVLKNLDMLLNWLEENKLFPRIDPFSGELFAQQVGFQAVEKVLDFYIRNNLNEKDQHYIVIPTNFTFIFSKNRTSQVEYLLQKAKDNKIKFFLSASVDGKYCDNENRPTVSGRQRDDKYYDDVFSFVKKWDCSFHPMIYSHNVEKWIDNFLWFQDMFKKHGLPPWSLYLLEVRNENWTRKQLKEIYKFFRFIVKWFYTNSGITNGSDFIKYAGDVKLANIFSIFYRVGRGTGCSVQSTMQLRLGDLSHSVCHRTSYDPFLFWKFVDDGEKIIDIEAINTPLFVSHQTLDEDNFPVCETCLINSVCTGQCLGSMYETNSSLFYPIPTVCALEHIKIKAIFDECIELNLFQHWYDVTSNPQQNVMRIYYDNYWKENKNGF